LSWEYCLLKTQEHFCCFFYSLPWVGEEVHGAAAVDSAVADSGVLAAAVVADSAGVGRLADGS
jgi:hypothetical protein